MVMAQGLFRVMACHHSDLIIMEDTDLDPLDMGAAIGQIMPRPLWWGLW